MSTARTFSTSTYALVSETFETQLEGLGWAYARDLLGSVRIRSTSSDPVFVGIAPAAALDAYLASSSFEMVRNLGESPRDTKLHAGTAAPAEPAAQTFWAASTAGGGDRSLVWNAQNGSWRVVLMNLDGTKAVEAELRVGAVAE